MIIINSEEYKKIIKSHFPKDNKIKNYFISFSVGGIIGLVAQLLVKLFSISFFINIKDASSCVTLLIIGLTSLLTGFGIFDNLVSKCKCGLLIPTTGFAHSVTSSAMEYRKDGIISGIGSNIFKLAGSVIIYGIVSAFIFCIIKVVLINV